MFELFASILMLFATSGITAENYMAQQVPSVEQAQTKKQVEVRVKGFPVDSEANLIATYTFNTYGLDYVELLNAENGAFTKERIHPIGYKRCITRIDKANNKRVKAGVKKLDNGLYQCYGTRHEFHDNGLCGMSDYYHPDVTNDPRFLTDWQRQVDQCVKKKKEGTIFYGREHRKARAEDRFTFIYP